MLGPRQAETSPAEQPRSTYPCKKGNHEEGPMMSVELPDQSNRVGELGQGRLQAGEACRNVLANAHAMVGRLIAAVLDANRGLGRMRGRPVFGRRFLVNRHCRCAQNTNVYLVFLKFTIGARHNDPESGSETVGRNSLDEVKWPLTTRQTDASSFKYPWTPTAGTP